MRIDLDIDALVLQAFIKRYPQAAGASINLFKDRVGYHLEGVAKKKAPAITGNLRRQMWYYRGPKGANLYAYAEYARYVHGKPFHVNKTRRKETKFFTGALKDSQQFIKDEARQILRRVLK